MWDRYKIELQVPPDLTYMQQFIEHPCHYRSTPPIDDVGQTNVHLLAITDKEEEPTDGDGPDGLIRRTEPSSSSHYRAGSCGPDVLEGELSPRNQLTPIVNHVTSGGKLEIMMSPVALGARKSYQSPCAMWGQF